MSSLFFLVLENRLWMDGHSGKEILGSLLGNRCKTKTTMYLVMGLPLDVSGRCIYGTPSLKQMP